MTGLLLFAAARFLVSVLALSVTADAAPLPGLRHPASASCLKSTCVLLATAPTMIPCFRHWRRSSLLLPKGEAKGFPAGKRLSLWESWTRSGLRGQAAFTFFNKESKTSGKHRPGIAGMVLQEPAHPALPHRPQPMCKFRCIGHCLEIPLDGAGAVLHFYEGIVKFLRSLVEER